MRAIPILSASCAALALFAVSLAAQQSADINDAGEARAALVEAQQQSAAARARAETLEKQAAEAGAAADRTGRQAAAAAARIQETQAQVAARQADIRLIDQQREQLRAKLAARQLPVVRLTGALERLSRRPMAFALLRPGSLRDSMHMRAMLDTMLPEVQKRTASLRGEIARGKALKLNAEAALTALRTEQSELSQRRQTLASLETQQRLSLRSASGNADREAERALTLAEQARDLDALTADLGRAGALRAELMRLPGPVIRPDNPALAQVPGYGDLSPAPSPSSAPAFLLPVQGRLVAGFGAASAGTPTSRGIALATGAGAQAVAPAPGRVAFAGPYRGYGAIVIIDHGNGWTSLITGLSQLDAHVS
ncbi:MAG: peptidoglycan DD-metalloendopeptidase family protein, partial [Novosphingobium sp.]